MDEWLDEGTDGRIEGEINGWREEGREGWREGGRNEWKEGGRREVGRKE